MGENFGKPLKILKSPPQPQTPNQIHPTPHNNARKSAKPPIRYRQSFLHPVQNGRRPLRKAGLPPLLTTPMPVSRDLVQVHLDEPIAETSYKHVCRSIMMHGLFHKSLSVCYLPFTVAPQMQVHAKVDRLTPPRFELLPYSVEIG